MSENVENLILEHLRHMRAKVDKLDERMDECLLRLSSIQPHMAAFHVSGAEHGRRMDAFDKRLDQIEKRLELRDAE